MTLPSPAKTVCLLLLCLALLFGLASAAHAAGPTWALQMSHEGSFERPEEGGYTVAYAVAVENSGGEATAGNYTLTDMPPPELTVESVIAGAGWTCTTSDEVIAGAPLSCHSQEVLAPGASVTAVRVLMRLTANAPEAVTNNASISGGGAGEASASDPTAVLDRLPFGVDAFSARSLDEAGNDYTQAGGHPYEATASFSFPTYQSRVSPAPVQDVKDLFTEVPPGLIANASSFPRCELTRLQPAFPTCPAASQIGTLALGTLNNPGFPTPLYNMVPERGFPAEFAFKSANNTVALYPRLRPRTGGYGVTVVTPGASRVQITSIKVVLFGIPSKHNGVGGAEVPFLANPVDCGEAQPTTKIIVDSWQHPGLELPGPDFGSPDLSDPLWKAATSLAPAVIGCEAVSLASQFHPSIDVTTVQPVSPVQADQPTGLKVDLDFPQANDPTDLNTVFDPSLPQAPELKDAIVQLPGGLSISASAGQGLGGCSDQASDPTGDQVHYDNTNPVSCPEDSMIGTVTATSPLLAAHDPATDAVTGAESINGDVYVLKPHPGDLTQGQDGRFRVLIQVESARDGINVKVPGSVVADKTTGQLTATFTENPQLPIKHLEVSFFAGPRAPLASPVTCGTFTTRSDLVPWSTPGTPDASPSSSFQVAAGANGAPCPASADQRPFSPTLTAEDQSTAAGGWSPFVLSLARNDGEQELGALNLAMPRGFTAKLAGIPYCSEAAIAAAETNSGGAEQANPSCPLASQVGSLTAGAGAGTNPYYVNGKAYLAGPFKGAPLSLVFITPAVAGPFDLGSVVVRAAVFVNPTTAQVTVKTDPIPQIVDGVPLRIRSIVARIDRPNFTLNPTSCDSMSLTGEAAGSSGAIAALSSHFQVGGCDGLKFAPKFSVSTTGQASKANGASLTAKLSYPYAANGAVNLTRVKVELPKQLPSRLTTLQKACTSAQFEANPAGCAAASIIGHASVETPLLPVPLTGPAYFVSHGGEAFPSLVVVLQGYGITVDLVGSTQIKGGITSTTFKTVPDVPFTSFELTLPQGQFSALGANLPAKANYNFCAQKMVMPTELIAQNGAAIHQSTKISVSGCKAKAASKAQKLAAALKACKTKTKGKRAACAKAARRQFAAARRPNRRK